MPTKRNWVEVNTSAKLNEIRLDPGAGELRPTGLLKLNTEASIHWDACLRSKREKSAAVVTKFMVDGQVISARPVPHGTPGGTAFRVTPVKGGKTPLITLYLHGVFEEYPHLRPATRCKVSVIRETGDDNIPYLVINLQSAVAVRTVPRDKEEAEAESAAAAQKATGKRGRKTPPEPGPEAPGGTEQA